MTLQIEAGKYYRTRDGRKVGPIVGPDSDGIFDAHEKIDSYIPMWRADGRNEFFAEYTEPQYDIIAEWVDEPEKPDPDTPKLWRDMTDAEKGALLLAHHEGRTIERWVDESLGWKIVPPQWRHEHAYRVRPEPKRETVTLYAGDTIIGTIDMIDGKPDPDSIRMEQV